MSTPTPLFKPFEWVAESKQAGPYDMLSDVRDLAAGVALVLQLVERTEMKNQIDEAPLLDVTDTGCLTRMAIAAMRTIENRIHNHFEDMRGDVLRSASEYVRSGT